MASRRCRIVQRPASSRHSNSDYVPSVASQSTARPARSNLPVRPFPSDSEPFSAEKTTNVTSFQPVPGGRIRRESRTRRQLASDGHEYVLSKRTMQTATFEPDNGERSREYHPRHLPAPHPRLSDILQGEGSQASETTGTSATEKWVHEHSRGASVLGAAAPSTYTRQPAREQKLLKAAPRSITSRRSASTAGPPPPRSSRPASNASYRTRDSGYSKRTGESRRVQPIYEETGEGSEGRLDRYRLRKEGKYSDERGSRYGRSRDDGW